MDYRNIITRAAWTFVQAAAAVLVVGGVTGDVAKAAAIAGVAAVISFAKTVATEQLAK